MPTSMPSHADFQMMSSSSGKNWKRALSLEGTERPGVSSRLTQLRVSAGCGGVF